MWARHPAPSLGNPPGLVGIKKTSFELRDSSRTKGHLEILGAGSRGSLFFTTYSQTALFYLQHMALLGFFLPPYAVAIFEHKSVS